MTGSRALQTVLDSAGPQAAGIEWLWWMMFWTTTVVFVLVMAALAVAVVRGRRRDRDGTPPTPQAQLHRALSMAVGATVVVLLGLLVASFWTGRHVASLHADSAVTISVVGYQWWWEIEYGDSVPSRRVTTANEIHIPTGRPIVLKVTSRDVIHSFWVPNLHGKRDLIPGYTTAIWLQADRAGIYRGQCAEFCGRQHAHMAFDVVAEPPADFERWLDARRQPAPEPQTDEARRGRAVFMAARCSVCHEILGTEARARVAPVLTHVGSRSTLGAGTLPNTREHLASWLKDPQATKPGNQMPPNILPADDLQALVTYLASLK